MGGSHLSWRKFLSSVSTSMISSEMSTFAMAWSPVCLKSSRVRSGTVAKAAIGSTSSESLLSIDLAASLARSPSCPLDTWLTSFLIKKRS